jgi:DNA polymerase-3 subunit alpha
VQPILGCQVDVDLAPVRRGSSRTPAPVVLLAQNETGMAQPDEAELLHLYLRGTGTLPHVTLEELARMARG